MNESGMLWRKTWRADPRAMALADRHYSRQSPGSALFAPPGRALVLVTEEYDALWVTSWQLYVQRAQHPSAWACSLFRNESPHLSSLLITQAVAATRAVYGEPPADGMVTMVDPQQVRRKRDPGRCFRRAGFEICGRTHKADLLILRLAPEHMPEPVLPGNIQLPLFGTPA